MHCLMTANLHNFLESRAKRSSLQVELTFSVGFDEQTRKVEKCHTSTHSLSPFLFLLQQSIFCSETYEGFEIPVFIAVIAKNGMLEEKERPARTSVNNLSSINSIIQQAGKNVRFWCLYRPWPLWLGFNE